MPRKSINSQPAFIFLLSVLLTFPVALQASPSRKCTIAVPNIAVKQDDMLRSPLIYAGSRIKNVRYVSLDGKKLVPLSMLQANPTLDPSVPQNLVSQVNPDLGIGIHYSNPLMSNLRIGISATHLLVKKFYFTVNGNQQFQFSSLKTHYYLLASIDLPLNTSQVFIQPNILFKYGTKFQADMNLLAIYDTKYYAGISYRQGDNLNILIGFMLNHYKIGYSLDLVTTNLKPGSRTNHELFFQYCYSISKKPAFLLNPRHLKDYPL